MCLTGFTLCSVEIVFTNAQAPAISGIALETAVKDYYEIDSIIERLSKKINAALLRAI
jgi:DNA gyrase subunit B